MSGKFTAKYISDMIAHKGQLTDDTGKLVQPNTPVNSTEHDSVMSIVRLHTMDLKDISQLLETQQKTISALEGRYTLLQQKNSDLESKMEQLENGLLHIADTLMPKP